MRHWCLIVAAVVLSSTLLSELPQSFFYGVAHSTRHTLWHPAEPATYNHFDENFFLNIAAFEPHLGPTAATLLHLNYSAYLYNQHSLRDTIAQLQSYLSMSSRACSYVSLLQLMRHNNTLSATCCHVGPLDVMLGITTDSHQYHYQMLTAPQNGGKEKYVISIPVIQRSADNHFSSNYQTLQLPGTIADDRIVYSSHALGSYLFNQTPNIQSVTLSSEHRFILIAPSTLWRYISYDAAAFFIHSMLQKALLTSPDPATHLAQKFITLINQHLEKYKNNSDHRLPPFYAILIIFNWNQ